MNEFLKKLSHELRTQDNRITANPLFCVQQKRRIWGVDSMHTNEYEWLDADNDYSIADDETKERLDKLGNEYKSTGSWEKACYVDHWDFVTAHFTEKAAQRYIDENNHNLNKPRICVTSQYRCYEFNEVVDYLKGIE